MPATTPTALPWTSSGAATQARPTSGGRRSSCTKETAASPGRGTGRAGGHARHPVRWLVLGLAWSALGLLRVLGQFGLFGRVASVRSWGDWALTAVSVGCGLVWLGLWRSDRRGGDVPPGVPITAPGDRPPDRERAASARARA